MICSSLESLKIQKIQALRNLAIIPYVMIIGRLNMQLTLKNSDKLGWVPESDFETSIHKTMQWYVNNEYWWKRASENIESSWLKMNNC